MTGPKPLDPTSQATLLTADRAVVVSALTRLPISGSNTWLAPGNLYFESASDRVQDDKKSVPSSQFGDFVDYLAAASFVHTADSWSYLGRALHALLQGDVHGAVHLCYYSELRAAIALMSSEGVFVGNYGSLVATAAGAELVDKNSGTHNAAWQCLDSWASSTRARDLFGKVLRPIGAPLHEWADNMGSGIQPVLESLLTDVAFDLASFAKDRNRRNRVSYQPSRVRPDDLNVRDAAAIVDDVWTLLEPESRGTFPVLDRLLLQHLAVGVYGPINAEFDDDDQPTGAVDWTNWATWLDNVAPSGALLDPYFISMRKSAVDVDRDRALDGAFDRHPGPPSAYVREMILRTTVLARVATGACVELLSDSGLTAADVTPWVSGLGEARALWGEEAPDPMLDLWADAETAKMELDTAPKTSYYSLIRGLRENFAVLGQAERVAAWSFAG